MSQKKPALHISIKILIAMFAGIVLGLILNILPSHDFVSTYITNGLLDVVSRIFITLLKMLVVPIVFVSLICGVCSLDNIKKLGRMGLKTVLLYLLTTAIAIALGIFFASLFQIGKNHSVPLTADFNMSDIPKFKDTIVDMFPSNPIAALAQGKMLQIIFFSLLMGIAIIMAGKKGAQVKGWFESLNTIVMRLVDIVMVVMPYGVFTLIAKQFAHAGFHLIVSLAAYFGTVLFVLFFHCLVTYSAFLKFFARLNPIIFLRKMFPAMLFGFSTSSSAASIPVTLNVVEEKLGVSNSVASFVIPLGATINMDGTAIMQGVATVFIAHVYGIQLGLIKFLTIILMATFASIGTAAVPSVGLITLTMVLQQVGIPIEGVAMIIGVDRLLDMVRTSVNISGDSMVACLVGKSAQEIDLDLYNAKYTPGK
jgi:Na+/H+-dicarboxylate symporter